MPDTARATLGKWLQWLAVSLVGLTGLALAAAHAPARVRLLLLMSVLFGAFAGWGMALAARHFGIAAGRVGIAVVGLLVAAALVGQTLEAWRVNVQRRKAAYIEKSKASPLARIGLEEFLDEKMAAEWRFDTYLQGRLAVLKQNLGSDADWPLAVAVAFWLCEVLAGAVVAAWLFRRSCRPDPAQDRQDPQNPRHG